MMSSANSSTINSTMEVTLDPFSTVALVSVMTIIDVVAIAGSISVMTVIAKTPQLRILTLLFVFNLCVADLAHSLTVTPLTIATVAHGGCFFIDPVCKMTGFLDSFFTFVSISSVCVISVERYYSIVRPMVHAAHLTLIKALLAIGVIWFLALVFAVAPLLGWNSYAYDPFRMECTFSWSDGGASVAYAIVISVVYFCIPTLVMSVMYIFIYRTARKASRESGPLPSPLLPEGQTHNPSGEFLQVPPTSLTCKDPKVFSVSGNIEHHPSASSSEGESFQRKTHTNESLKATKTLLLVFGLFILTWGPYFTGSLYLGLVGGSKGAGNAGLWLKVIARASFALNPLVYGLLNRQVRLELYKTLRSLCGPAAASLPMGPSPSDINLRSFDVDGSQVENFFQFLERTNAMDKKDRNGAKTTKNV